jgi:iron(III) transport system permease protein
VFCILISAFQDDTGSTDLALFLGKITDDSIWSLACLTGGRYCGAAWNSLALAIVVGALSTLLGLAFALIATRTRFPFPRVLK